MLVPALLDVVLLWPILSSVDLVPGPYRYAYFEPRDGSAEVVLARQSDGGYMSEVQAGGAGDMVVPAGRTIGIPLEDGHEIEIRTNAPDLAPYLVLGAEVSWESGSTATSSLSEPIVLVARDEMLAGKSWDPNLPWAIDREWLRELAQRCRLPSSTPTTVRLDGGEVVVRLGQCSGRVSVSTSPSRPAILAIVSGPHDATLSKASGWRTSREIDWKLIGLAIARNGILYVALGIGPTIVTAGALVLAGFLARPVAILTWYAVLLIGLAVCVGRLVTRRRSATRGLGWLAGGAFIAAEILAIVAWVQFSDAGTFGRERMTRSGDNQCSIVGYSTVRGDALRHGSSGIVERLNDACAPCMNRTSRFSREAQTLHWVRQVVCDPSFPAPPAGDVVFVGGGNDDLFYQSNGIWARLANFVGLLQFMVSPVSVSQLEGLFDHANQRAVATLNDQEADIREISGCIHHEKRRFWFLHDFLVWDLDRGRSAARQATFERRRSAVGQAGGEFIDLLEEFRDTAGVAWLNDFIHPSAVGQEKIAALLCDRISLSRD